VLQPPPARRLALGAGAVLLSTLALAGCADPPASGELRPAASSPPAPTASPTDGSAVRGTVVTLGDSIMSGYGIDPRDAWPTLLESETGHPIVNLGCDGAGFVEEGDCGTDYAGLIPEIVAESPALVIVQSSDNDADDSPAAIRSATRHTVERLHAALPTARIVGLGTLWNLPWDPPETIQVSSDALEEAVTDVGGTFVPIGQPFQDDPDLLQEDGEHPTAEGQRVLASVIRVALIDAGVAL
jgi:acyl-CoA thioesterase-1